MYSAYKLNKQGDNIQPWGTSFPIWNQSVVLCPVLTVASWPPYRFLKRQVRWSGIPISFRIFHRCIQVNNYNKIVRLIIELSLLLSGKSHGWEEPGRLQSMGLRRVRHDWATSLSLFTFMNWRRKWQPTPVFLPGESQAWGSLMGCRLRGRTESNTTEVT